MHDDLLAALTVRSGLILVAGPTAHGKTTAIENVLADPACPRGVVFAGDIRGDREHALDAVSKAHSMVVVAVLRIGRGAGVFRRLLDLGVPDTDIAEVARTAFTTRLFRLRTHDGAPEVLLLHERLAVTDAIRTLIPAGADTDAIHRQAMADGMRSLRTLGLEYVKAGRLSHAHVVEMTPDD